VFEWSHQYWGGPGGSVSSGPPIGDGAIGDATAAPSLVHDHQGGPPLPPPFGEHDPKEAISWAELRAFMGTRQCSQLLTKRQVLKGHRSVSAAHQSDRSEENDQRRQHT
jgi:hypothetical protein